MLMLVSSRLLVIPETGCEVMLTWMACPKTTCMEDLNGFTSVHVLYVS